MKHLLTILILFGFAFTSFAEETYLGCWKDGSDELIYEIDINENGVVLLYAKFL